MFSSFHPHPDYRYIPTYITVGEKQPTNSLSQLSISLSNKREVKADRPKKKKKKKKKL
jgi:hypothetical protein